MDRRTPMKGFEICVHTCVEDGCLSSTTRTVLWKREGGACPKHAKKRVRHPNCDSSCPGYPFLNTPSCPGRPTKTPTEIDLMDTIPIIRQLGTMEDSVLAFQLRISNADLISTYTLPEHPGNEMDVDLDVTTASSSTQVQDYRNIDIEPDGDQAHAPSPASTSRERRAVDVGEVAASKRPACYSGPLKVLYVPDPSRRNSCLRDAESDLSFSRQTIEIEIFHNLRVNLPGFIFSRPGGRGKNGMIEVYINEWVGNSQQ